MSTFGAATNLVAGTLVLTLPAGSRFWYLDNQSAAPITVTFFGDTNGAFGPRILNPHSSGAGYTGDALDSLKFPWTGTSVTLTSSVATAQFGSGYSANDPE